jgi:phosphinothricin acetyltransferase
MISKANIKDAKAITDIYNYYVINDIATFAETPLSIEAMIENIDNSIVWYVYKEQHKILGYAYASIWKPRSAYRFTAEVSVYLDSKFLGKGIGSKLYSHLLSELKRQNFHSVIGGISLPNIVSEKLHEKFEFQKVAHFKDVGFKFNKWIDVGYWERIL